MRESSELPLTLCVTNGLSLPSLHPVCVVSLASLSDARRVTCGCNKRLSSGRLRVTAVAGTQIALPLTPASEDEAAASCACTPQSKGQLSSLGKRDADACAAVDVHSLIIILSLAMIASVAGSHAENELLALPHSLRLPWREQVTRDSMSLIVASDSKPLLLPDSLLPVDQRHGNSSSEDRSTRVDCMSGERGREKERKMLITVVASELRLRDVKGEREARGVQSASHE